jgi:CelD/BcsL family acetyltransferase involved in cellulose biosynthesis
MPRGSGAVTVAWSIVEHRGHEGLSRLEADWRRLVAAMPDGAPRHSFEAYAAYFRHVSRADGQFSLFALTDGERVRAICPLEPETVDILGRRTRVWGLPCHDLGRDLVCPPDEARREFLPRLVRFLGVLRGRPTWLAFSGVIEGSAAWECLRSLDAGEYCTEVAGASDVIDCQGSFETLIAGLSAKTRDNLKRSNKRLAALTDIRFVTVSDSASVAREFESFLDLESSGWKGEAGTCSAVRQKPEKLAFFRELSTSVADSGRFEIDALYADGRCIASQLCFRDGSEITAAKIAYDEQYARISPGQLLVERFLRRCCQDPELRRVSIISHSAWAQAWRPRAVSAHLVFIGLGRRFSPLLVRALRFRLKNGPRAKRWVLLPGPGMARRARSVVNFMRRLPWTSSFANRDLESEGATTL